MFPKTTLPFSVLVLLVAGVMLVAAPAQALPQHGVHHVIPHVGGVHVGGFHGGVFPGGGIHAGGFVHGGGFSHPGSAFHHSGNFFIRSFAPRYGYSYGYPYGYGYSSGYAYPSMNYVAPTYVYPDYGSGLAYPADARLYQQAALLDNAGSTGSGVEQRNAPAVITVQVPADADVWFGDWKAQATGTTRTFDSPPLTPGQRYHYEIKALWKENGRDVTQAQDVDVTAGSDVTIRFPIPRTGEAIPLSPMPR